MKKFFIRSALFLVFMAAALLNLTLIPRCYDVWSGGLAACFAIAVIFFTGRANIFILSTVFIATCVIPVAAIISLIRPLHGSWKESISNLASELWTFNPLHGFELIIPTLAAAISIFLMRRLMRARRTQG